MSSAFVQLQDLASHDRREAFLLAVERVTAKKDVFEFFREDVEDFLRAQDIPLSRCEWIAA